MNTVTMTFKQPSGRRGVKVHLTVDPKRMTLDHMRKLVEMEAFLNDLPGSTMRVHVEMPLDGDAQ